MTRPSLLALLVVWALGWAVALGTAYSLRLAPLWHPSLPS